MAIFAIGIFWPLIIVGVFSESSASIFAAFYSKESGIQIVGNTQEIEQPLPRAMELWTLGMIEQMRASPIMEHFFKSGLLRNRSMCSCIAADLCVAVLRRVPYGVTHARNQEEGAAAAVDLSRPLYPLAFSNSRMSNQNPLTVLDTRPSYLIIGTLL